MKHSLEKNVCISSSRMTASDSVSLPSADMCPVGVLQTWKDTDHRRCSHRLVRNAAFFEQNVP